jgi:hypothetical protein
MRHSMQHRSEKERRNAQEHNARVKREEARKYFSIGSLDVAHRPMPPSNMDVFKNASSHCWGASK